MLTATIVFLLLLAIGLALYLQWFEVRRSAWVVASIAFVLRVGYVFADRLFGIYAGGGDQSGYDATLLFVAEQWRSGVLFAPFQYGMSPGNDAYYMLVYSGVFSPAYAVFGHVPTLPRLQMALVGTLVVVNIYLITEYIYDTRAGAVAGLIAAVFPYWIVLSGIIYRDMFIIFFLSLMGYYLVRWQAGERQSSILLGAVVAGVVGLSLRPINIVAVGPMAVLAVYLMVNQRWIRYVGTFAIGLLASIIVYVNFGGYLAVERLAGRREWLARESPASYLTGIVYESYPELFAFLPIGAAYFALTPFPWQVVNVMAVIAVLQNLFLWYPILLLSVVGFRDAIHVEDGAKMMLPLVGFGLAGIFGYGLVEGNIGPAMRHRSQFQFVFFILAGIAIANRIQIKGVPRLGQDNFEFPGDQYLKSKTETSK